MKQVILLEQFEIDKLLRGRQLEIMTPGGALVIGFDRPQKTDTSTCTTCNKAFKNPHGLAVHVNKKHGGVNAKKTKKL